MMTVGPSGSRFKRLAKEGSWIVVGQLATLVGALVLVRMLTEYLNPAQYGQLALGLTVAGLVNQLVMGGLSNGIGRYYSIAAEKRDLLSYLHASRWLMEYATVVIVAIGLLISGCLFWLGYSNWIGLAVAALVFSVTTGYNGALSSIQNAARQRAIVAFHGGLDAWLKILLALGAVLWLGASSTAVVIGYACSSLVITLSQLILLRRTVPPQQSEPQRRPWIYQIWAYSLPFSTWGAFTWMQQVSDRWSLQAFASSAEVGRYAVLLQLGFTPVAVVTGMAMSFLGPILYQRSGDATHHARNAEVHRLGWRITYISLIVTSLGFAITVAMHESFFRLLVAAEYRGSSYLLPWVVLAGGLFAAGQMLGLKLMSEMKSSVMTTAKIVTALIGILCNVLGALFAGTNGVVGALVAFSAIYFVWMAVLGQHVLAKNLEN